VPEAWRAGVAGCHPATEAEGSRLGTRPLDPAPRREPLGRTRAALSEVEGRNALSRRGLTAKHAKDAKGELGNPEPGKKDNGERSTWNAQRSTLKGTAKGNPASPLPSSPVGLRRDKSDYAVTRLRRRLGLSPEASTVALGAMADQMAHKSAGRQAKGTARSANHPR
jgi:hypothetical protein